ncbi:15-hydroxyprostaglandin dehydrogenase [NAD(+)] [Habropoda laboriosa]|nr:15-hydroxyprostaglandin dehydrogenase [NAD(+)] [Habropoda laboriosa]
MDNIKNKTALVTGGASGLGLDYATKLLQNGAKAVALLDLSTSPGQTSATNLEKEFGKGKAVFFPCDVTNTKEFSETFKKVWNALNGLDIVINNAGMFDDRQWEKTIRLNVTGVVQGSLLALELMGKHKGGRGGTIVNISSIVGLQPYKCCPVYCASKHNVMAFSHCLQESFDITGVRILVMCPGVTSTGLLDSIQEKVLDFIDKEETVAMLSKLPSQSTDNVAQAMVSLIQKGMNGSVWVSEGGEPPFAVEFPLWKKVELNL